MRSSRKRSASPQAIAWCATCWLAVALLVGPATPSGQVAHAQDASRPTWAGGSGAQGDVGANEDAAVGGTTEIVVSAQAEAVKEEGARREASQVTATDDQVRKRVALAKTWDRASCEAAMALLALGVGALGAARERRT